MKVKISGITNREDAFWALNDGANFLGIDFRKKSPRAVLTAEAQTWVPSLPTFASVVGLFESESPDEIAQTAAEMNLKGVQLYGPQTPERLKDLRRALTLTEIPPFVIKAMDFPGTESLEDIRRWGDSIDYVLLCDPDESKPRRTPRPFDWSMGVAAAAFGKPVFLGGGLTAENVAEAVKAGRPFAVDVTSSIEKSTRQKHREKMRAFLTQALQARP
jgi:phosphoribosylanthranilate isomerase